MSETKRPAMALSLALAENGYVDDDPDEQYRHIDTRPILASLRVRGYALASIPAEPAQAVCQHPAPEVHLSRFARLDKQPDPDDMWWCKACGATWRSRSRPGEPEQADEGLDVERIAAAIKELGYYDGRYMDPWNRAKLIVDADARVRARLAARDDTSGGAS